jgi:5'-nucleotidase / UDP-sugar diphosphatase
VLAELPFGNVTVLIELSGADVKAALENGVSQVESGAGRFPQVSGLSFTYDARQPAGSRVVEVKVGGEALDPAATYRVATNDFLASGGDGYTALTRGRSIVDASAGNLMASTVINYMTALGGTVAPKVEGRITRLDQG